MDGTVEAVERLGAGWQFLPPVHVVETPGELPVAAPIDAQGMYLGGSVWLVDGALSQEVATVWSHELLGHHAPRELLGPNEWRYFMSAVRAGIDARDPALIRLLDHVRRNYDGSDLSKRAEADELVARVAELRAHPTTGVFMVEQTGWMRVRALLSHAGRRYLHLPIPASLAEIESVLFEGRELLRRGRPLWACSAWWYPAQMPQPSKPMGPKIPARSLRESEQLLAGARADEGLVLTFKVTGIILLGIFSVGLTLWGAWDFFVAPLFR